MLLISNLKLKKKQLKFSFFALLTPIHITRLIQNPPCKQKGTSIQEQGIHFVAEQNMSQKSIRFDTKNDHDNAMTRLTVDDHSLRLYLSPIDAGTVYVM